MLDTTQKAAASTKGNTTDYEVVVVGAGVCGIFQIYRLMEMGVNANLLEAGGDVGGTWYWNRYPGARFDSESVTYGFSFSKELLQEWDWSERFSPQPETERYLRHVVDKFDLRRHMQFNCRVLSAEWDEASRIWTLHVSDGRKLRTRFLLTCLGMLSVPTLPRYAGMATFEGQSFHTYNWPREPIDYTGKRVAVIGTGATGVQVISALADKVTELTVFQRRPNWCAPLHNAPLMAEEMKAYKQRYDEIFEMCHASPSGFWHNFDRRKTLEVPEAERLAFWDKLYAEPGFGIWVGNFKDSLTDEQANAALTDFIAGKIRERVKDPKLAEKLIPKDHGFGTRRLPLETRYYETYNRDNVHLVDACETPIERITPTGIRTSQRDYEFDIIVYATGFDAITGAYEKVDFVGTGGQRLKTKWENGPLTAYGLMTHGFPNLITVAGPQSGSVATNFPRGIEEAVNWVTGLLQRLSENGLTRIEARQETETMWVSHVAALSQKVLLGKQRSWFNGYNSNLDRPDTIRHLIYVGGAIRYREFLTNERASDYAGFEVS